MKKRIIYLIIIFLAIILQTSVLPSVCRKCVAGDIVLTLVLAGAVLDGFFGFLGWAIFAGIIYDLISYSPVGIHALAYLLLVYFVSFFSRRFSVEIRGVGVILFAFFVAIGTLISRTFMTLVELDESFSFEHFLELFGNPRQVFLQIFFNLILFAACLLFFAKIKKFYSLN